MIKIHDDREFLLPQREKGRCGSLGPVDLKLAKVKVRFCKRKQLTKHRRKREQERMVALSESSRPIEFQIAIQTAMEGVQLKVKTVI